MSKKEKNVEKTLPTKDALKAEIKREKIKHLYKRLLKSTIYALTLRIITQYINVFNRKMRISAKLPKTYFIDINEFPNENFCIS